MHRAADAVQVRVFTKTSETLRSLKNAPSHRPDVLRESDMVSGNHTPKEKTGENQSFLIRSLAKASDF